MTESINSDLDNTFEISETGKHFLGYVRNLGQIRLKNLFIPYFSIKSMIIRKSLSHDLMKLIF